jgi:hypothetical protein
MSESRARAAKWKALGFGLATSALIAMLFVILSPDLRFRIAAGISPERSIGVWQDDSVFGFSHIQGVVGRHHKDGVFDVTYTIDENGFRRTPDPIENRGRVLALGGSFTFGHGVQDDESWPARLGQLWPQLKVVNAAVNGWGTAHALLMLERELEGDPPVLVIYGWIPEHVGRSYIRRGWLEVLAKHDRRHPHFEIGPKGLEYRGVVGVEQSVPESTPGLEAKQQRISTRMVETMHKLCEAAGVPFVVVVLGPSELRIPRWRNVRVEDPGAYQPLANENHPSPDSHERVARHLAAELRELVPPADGLGGSTPESREAIAK